MDEHLRRVFASAFAAAPLRRDKPGSARTVTESAGSYVYVLDRDPAATGALELTVLERDAFKAVDASVNWLNDNITVADGLDVAGLVRDLRAVGAVNVAGGRRRSLTGRRRWGRFVERLPHRADGRLAVTVELIFGQAWGRGGVARRGSPAGEIRVPISRIKRHSEST
jgi:hypothetical protein